MVWGRKGKGVPPRRAGRHTRKSSLKNKEKVRARQAWGVVGASNCTRMGIEESWVQVRQGELLRGIGRQATGSRTRLGT